MQTKSLNILLEEANNLVKRLNYAEAIELIETSKTVSYTHLTLPTLDSV